MRRIIAALVLALFAFLIAADAVCCPDGCTNEAQSPAQHSTSAGAVCLLCLGGADATPYVVALAAPVIADRVPPHPLLVVSGDPNAPPHRPPRA